eukprot:1152346-Pelagomonas_calceolata.AAC.15
MQLGQGIAVPPHLEHIDQHHGVSHTPDVHILLVCHAQIDDHPADQAWVHLAELLPVKHARPAPHPKQQSMLEATKLCGQHAQSAHDQTGQI